MRLIEKSDPATCYHVNVTERPRYAIDDEPGHYLCLDCGDKFPLIGDTDKWEPKALDPASEPRECPYCDGRGWNTIAVHDPTDPDGEPLPEQEQCATCGGSGEVS